MENTKIKGIRVINGIDPFPVFHLLSEDYTNLLWQPSIEEYSLLKVYDVDINDSLYGINSATSAVLSAMKNNDLVALKKSVSGKDNLKSLNSSKDNGAFDPLFVAVSLNQIPIVEWMLKQGFEVNKTDSSGNTALIICSFYGHIDMLKILLESGANPDTCDSKGRSPLMVACQEEHLAAIDMLLDNYADTELKTTSGQNLLFHSILKGNLDILKRILTVREFDLNETDDNGMTLLMLASYCNHFDIVEYLCSNGAKVNLQDRQGNTSLMIACQGGNDDIVNYLINKGADVNAKTIHDLTALTYACINSHLEVVQCILVRVKNINHETRHGETALMISCYQGQLDIVTLLVDKNAGVDYENRFGKNPLMSAAEGGYMHVVRFLVGNGATIHKASTSETRAIHLAMLNNHTEIVDYLLKEEGKTVGDDLILACLYGNVERVNRILRRKGRLNIKDELGRTPLMAASQQGHLNIIYTLLNGGVDINEQNSKGITALGYALLQHKEGIPHALIQHGALIDNEDTKGRSLLMNCVLSNDFERVKEVDFMGANIFHRDNEGKNALMIACENGNYEIAEHLTLNGTRLTTQCKAGMTAMEYAFVNDRKDITSFFSSLNDSGENEKENGTRLIKASEDGKSDIVLKLLQLGANPNYINEENTTALMEASQKDHVEIMEMLIRYKARVNFRSPSSGRTSLFDAALLGKYHAIQCLLEHHGSVNIADNDYRTPLMCAVQENITEIVRLLIKHGAYVNAKDKSGRSALTFAVKDKCVETARTLLENGCRVDEFDQKGTTPLGLASKNGSIEMVKLLVEHNANIDHVDYKGKTALMDAAEEGHEGIVRFLLQRKPNVTLSSHSGYTALDYAGLNHHGSVFHELQMAGSPIGENVKVMMSGESGCERLAEEMEYRRKNKIFNIEDIERAVGYRVEHNFEVEQFEKMAEVVHTAKNDTNRVLVYNRGSTRQYSVEPNEVLAKKSEQDECEVMLCEICQNGFNDEIRKETFSKVDTCVNKPICNGQLPIFYSLQNKQTDVILWLLEKGAKVNIQDSDGCSPLIRATMYEDLELIKCIMNHQPNINLQNHKGLSAVHYASEDGPWYLVEYLLENGALVNQENAYGITSLMLAANKGNTDVVKGLLKHKAALTSTDKEGNNTLCHCAMGTSMNCADIVNILCDHGTDVNLSNDNGDTALLLSIESGNILVTQELIKQGADFNCQNRYGDTFLMQLCQKEHLALMKDALSHVSAIHRETILSVFQFLILNLNYDLLQILLQNTDCLKVYKTNQKSLVSSLVVQQNFEGLKMVMEKEKYGFVIQVLSQFQTYDSNELEKEVCEYVNTKVATVSDENLKMSALSPILSNGNYRLADLLLGNSASHSQWEEKKCIFTNFSESEEKFASTWELPYKLNGQLTKELKTEVVEEKEDKKLTTSKPCDQNTMEDLPIVSSGIHQPYESSSLHQPNESRSLHQPNGSSTIHQPNESSTIHQPNELSSLHQPNESSSLYQPNESSNIHQPNQSSNTHQPNMPRSVHQPNQSNSVHQPNQSSSLHQPNESSSLHQPNVSSSTHKPNVSAGIKSDTVNKSLTSTIHIDDIFTNSNETEEKPATNSVMNHDIVKKLQEELEKTTQENKKLKQLLKTKKEETASATVDKKCICNKADCTLCQLREGTKQASNIETTKEQKAADDNHTKEHIEEIKTPGVLRLEAANNKKEECKVNKTGICTPDNLCEDCCKKFETVIETMLQKSHGDKNPCGQCETCFEARSMMIKLLGYEPQDDSHDYLGNQRHVYVQEHPDKPYPKMYLFKFHTSVSQVNIDGQKIASTACAIIAMLFAHKFTLDPSSFAEKPPIHDIPDKVFDQAEESIREGNETHSVNFKGQPVNLGPDEVTLLTTHLGITLIKETDVDTRDLSTVVDHVMNLKPKQVILFIKNYKVVSIMPCNNNRWVLLFDSHPHFAKIGQQYYPFGAYIFFARKEKETIKNLFSSYDSFCDPIPFYGKFAIFQV